MKYLDNLSERYSESKLEPYKEARKILSVLLKEGRSGVDGWFDPVINLDDPHGLECKWVFPSGGMIACIGQDAIDYSWFDDGEEVDGEGVGVHGFLVVWHLLQKGTIK